MTKFSNIKAEKQQDSFIITAVRRTGTIAKIKFWVKDAHLLIIPSHADSEELPEMLEESESWNLYHFIKSSPIKTIRYDRETKLSLLIF